MAYNRALIGIGVSKMLDGQVGVLALRDLSPGEIIAPAEEYAVKKLSREEFSSLDGITRERVLSFGLGYPDGFEVPADINFLSTPWYMNHCCDGNVGINAEGDFEVIRSVKKGEELCWDYGLAETNPDFKMECKCGKAACRKIITGNDWMDPGFQSLNNSHMLPELRR